MGILFKTYNGKHQLHVYGESWKLGSSAELKEILALFDKKNAAKAAIVPAEEHIDLTLNDMIISCRDPRDLKYKFSKVADFKIRYQKIQ